MFDQCNRKLYKFIVFFTPEVINDLSILGGGGGGGGDEITFDTPDGAITKSVKFLQKKPGILVYPLCFPYPGSSKAKKNLPIYAPPPLFPYA